MKKILLLIFAISSLSIYAGNSDRIGESGAPELIMNGWARSTGMWDLNTSRIMGLGSMRLNPAGLSFVKKMEISLAHTFWFAGSQTNLSHLGFATKAGADNVIGISLMSMNVGDIPTTTTDNPGPDNGLGSFSPGYFNLGLTFSRNFSSRIHGGATVRIISESAKSINAFGVAFDAGLQYVLGEKENLRFGVSIRNLGTPMKFSGDDLYYRGQTPDNKDFEQAVAPNTNTFELPALLTMGASYDLWMGNEYKCNGGHNMHRLTFAGTYNANSYGNDNFGLGIEYGFKEMFMARVGYRYEDGNFAEVPINLHSGLAAGVSMDIPFKIGGPSLSIDYSFRHTVHLAGTHSMGLGFKLGDGNDNPCLSTKDKEESKGKDAFGEETSASTEVKKPVVPKVEAPKKIKISKKEKAELERISSAVNFETGSSNLTTESKSELDALITFMNKKKDARIQIDAFTDNVGDEESNLDLSRERAYAVKSYLINKGIDKDRLKSKGYGESETFDNSTAEGRAQNRRVEISIR